MVKYYISITIALLLQSGLTISQDLRKARVRAMFYNVENLFDPFDDTLTNDNEFTPAGARHWTWDKMNNKINGIYKIIAAIGEWDPPTFVGLCEIENGLVLNRLVTETPLSKFEYKVIHRESNDPRGIDVALLYRNDVFVPYDNRFFRIISNKEKPRATREILYVCGLLSGIDTIHIFINHWPSKFGGELETESARFDAALTLRQKVDSIRVFYPEARILIMGDFNDEPESIPLTEKLGACNNLTSSCKSGLINVSAILKELGAGSYKYQGSWGMIDQIIISESFLSKKHGIWTEINKASVFKPKFLLEPDDAYTGDKPFRTFIGYRYHGGYSDHLPVYIDFLMQ